LGKNIASRFAHRYYTEISVGCDLEAIDIADNKFNSSLAHNFDNSAIIGHFVDKTNYPKELSIVLEKDNTISSHCNIKNIFSLTDSCIEEISRYMTLKIGDLLFIDIGLRSEKLYINNTITGKLDDKSLLDFRVL
jgi:hypothetical protein